MIIAILASNHITSILRTSGDDLSEEVSRWESVNGQALEYFEVTEEDIPDAPIEDLKIENGALVISLENKKKRKIAELREACRVHIFAGFDSDALGVVHRYPAKQDNTNFDQTNIVAHQSSAINNPNKTYKIMCADENGVWERRKHTAQQTIEVGEALTTFKDEAIEKLDKLIKKVNRAKTENGLNKINW